MAFIARFIVTSCSVLVAACAARPPITYESAIAENAKRPDAGPAQEWATSVLSPFWDAQIAGLMKNCLDPASPEAPSHGRLVIRFSRRGVTVPFKDGVPASFPGCLSSSVMSLTWPQSPFEGLYLAVEVTVKPSDPSVAAGEADAIMDAMSRSNTSLQRKRER